MSYDFGSIEKKWRERWSQEGAFRVDLDQLDKKFYTLVMFPYPSGDKLHMGHWYQYGVMDSWARFQRLRGKEIFFPMGFDAFGLPAENFAVKHGIHPDISTRQNVAYMREQFHRMGVTYHFDHEINTSQSDYYRWTQWVFLKLYEKGLAYRKKAPVNWCPSCKTVLANEQVSEGQCERCDSEVSQKDLEQWFFKITEYAQHLLDGLDELDWPDKTRAMQRNWIGRSVGAEVEFQMEDAAFSFRIFTTRPDTLFGVTYMVFAPEHPRVLEITTPAQKEKVEAYIETSRKTTEVERLATTREKTGVFTGSYAINPVNGTKIPIWIGDYVLASYGTGIVMAVPAHDQRDFEFARAFDLPIQKVILAPGSSAEDPLKEAYTEAGSMINSAHFNGISNDEMKESVIQELVAKGLAQKKINFRLRDWLVSRQRYWGSPIPIIYCDQCGEVPVPEEKLPVELPSEVDFKPTGESPLKTCQSFVNTSCPKCSSPARREADTLDTFVCSSFYYLRYPDPKNPTKLAEKQILDKMLPVDHYVGGPEHACMHLLYARFINMVLNDLGYVKNSEPFTRLTHQGMILGPDGQKMSKSKGNTISPDSYVENFGSDVLRLYLCFGFNYLEGGPWSEGGFKAAARFADRIFRLFEENEEIFSSTAESREPTCEDKKLLYQYHYTIKSSTRDTEKFQFNTSIARFMELYNVLGTYLKQGGEKSLNKSLLREIFENYLIMLSPFLPHLCEEWWERSGKSDSIFNQDWPVHDEVYLKQEEINMAVMINGKVRAQVQVGADAPEESILKTTLAQTAIQRHLEGKTLTKHIFVKGKLINLIVK